MTTMTQSGHTYFPLSMVAHKNGDYEHAVYLEGSWLLFTHKGKQVSRRVHLANGWLKYVVFQGKRHHIDDSCTMR